MTLYFFLLITVIRVFVPITCDAFVGLKIYSTHVNWFFSPVVVLVVQSCPALCNPMDCSPPGSSVHEFSRQEYWNGLPFPSPGVFPTQDWNPGLLLCRQILYHLSHQGSYFCSYPSIIWKDIFSVQIIGYLSILISSLIFTFTLPLFSNKICGRLAFSLFSFYFCFLLRMLAIYVQVHTDLRKEFGLLAPTPILMCNLIILYSFFCIWDLSYSANIFLKFSWVCFSWICPGLEPRDLAWCILGLYHHWGTLIISPNAFEIMSAISWPCDWTLSVGREH